MSPILSVKNLKKSFPLRRGFKKVGEIKALDGITFDLQEEETLAIVGESGCGKSTLAKLLLGLEHPTEGEIFIEGEPVTRANRSRFRKKIQMIFQDPYASLNPRKKAWKLIAEPLFINTHLSARECHHKALEMMEKVGLRPEHGERYPHMFSGGQRQRIGIARALMLEPKILVCDEPVSALDVSVQAQVMNLLLDLQKEFKLSYLFISHDLSVVRHLSDRVLVIYLGTMAELGTTLDIFNRPQHPYTKVLLSSSLDLRRDQNETSGF